MVEIRLDVLKAEGLALSKKEIVQHLMDKYGISKSGAYYHLRTLPKWIGQYISITNKEELTCNVLTQLTALNRELTFQYQHAKDDNSRIGYARTRIDVLCKILEFGLLANSDKPVAVSERANQITNCLKDKQKIESLLTPEDRALLSALANKIVVGEALNSVT